MYCTKCGKVTKEGYNFCTYCGASLSPKADREGVSNSPVKRDPTKIDYDQEKTGTQYSDPWIDELLKEESVEPKEKNRKETAAVPENSPEELHFHKLKCVGRLQVKETNTTIQVHEDRLVIKQEESRLFGKDTVKMKTYKLSDVEYVHTKIRFDLWNTGLAMIAIFYAIIGSRWWLLTAVLVLFVAYTKVVEIRLTNGQRFRIPTNHDSKNVYRLISICDQDRRK